MVTSLLNVKFLFIENLIKFFFEDQRQPFADVPQKCCSKKFVIFTGKHLVWSLFLIKLQTLGPATLSKRDSNTGVFL